MVKLKILIVIWFCVVTSACDHTVLNNPYSDSQEDQSILYSSFTERPKHLDPAISYSSNEYAIIGQIYEPPFQYHYLKRPYVLEPLTATAMPEIQYLDEKGSILDNDTDAAEITYTDYLIEIKPGIRYQPHPALAKSKTGTYLYHHLTEQQLANIQTLSDFEETGTRELVADDYIYQIKRLVHPKTHSPIAELMKGYIDGLSEFSERIVDQNLKDLRQVPISGVQAIDRYRYRVRIKGKYPQFIYWLAMPFFSPMPWEADVFYSQQGLIDKNISLDWFPIGTGPFMLEENNPNLRMVLVQNHEFHAKFYPKQGETEDQEAGLLQDAGKQLPFIEKVVYTLEKETIPYWSKFLQGYYDISGISSDSFDQAIQFTGQGDIQLTDAMKEKGIRLEAAISTSIFYMGFNMLDPVVGGLNTEARKLRQAISVALDYEEYISIFMNGRGVPSQGILPPGIFGYEEDEAGMNPYVYEWMDTKVQRKAIEKARELMKEAGYPDGIDPKTGESLILYLDTTATGPDDRARLNWYRKQFLKLGIQLVVRATDYNRFQQKMRSGNAQIFMWGWNADYPDPENFFFLLYGPNAKVEHGGENAVNYRNDEYDRLFEQMRNMDNGEERLQLIRKMQEVIRRDAPWVFGFHPKNFSLYHSWFLNFKPNLMANNTLKYKKINVEERNEKREKWNQPVYWPFVIALIFLVAVLFPAIRAYRLRAKQTIQ